MSNDKKVYYSRVLPSIAIHLTIAYEYTLSQRHTEQKIREIRYMYIYFLVLSLSEVRRLMRIFTHFCDCASRRHQQRSLDFEIACLPNTAAEEKQKLSFCQTSISLLCVSAKRRLIVCRSSSSFARSRVYLYWQYVVTALSILIICMCISIGIGFIVCHFQSCIRVNFLLLFSLLLPDILG